MIRSFLTTFVIFLGFALGAPAFAKPVVSDIRVSENAGVTRFVLDFSEPPAWRAFTLADPPRLVIDLPELVWNVPSNVTQIDKGVVAKLRWGVFAPGVSRVVLDLNGPAKIKDLKVLPPNDQGKSRLYVDLEAVSQAEFLSPEARVVLASSDALPEAGQVALPEPSSAGDNRPIIVIDAGHGGVDPGATSITGRHEKDIMLDWAEELAAQLDATGRYRVILTRDEDVFIPLRDRYKIAEAASADLFISLHANMHDSSKIKGTSVFTLSEKGADSDAEAASLAAKENTADEAAGIVATDDVAMILGDLMRRETMNLSKKFANMLVEDVGQVATLLRNTHRFANFAVLRSPEIPSVLVEVGYLSNKSEEKLLRTASHREKVCGAMVEAIDAFFTWQQALNGQ